MNRLSRVAAGVSLALVGLAAGPYPESGSPYRSYWDTAPAARAPRPMPAVPAVPAEIATASYTPGPMAAAAAGQPGPYPGAASTLPVPPALGPVANPGVSPANAPEGTVLAVPTGVIECVSCGRAGCGGCGLAVDLRDLLSEGWENARNGPQAAAQAPIAAPGGGGYGAMTPGAAYGAAATTPGYFGSPATGGPATPAAAAPAAGGGGLFSGLGGVGGTGNAAPPAVIGDQLPAGPISKRAEVPGQSQGLNPRQISQFGAQIRGFKISENQSPRPIDRVFGSFNFYDNINRSYDARVNANVRHVRAYRQLYGFEKTFLGGQASFGIRETVNSLNVDTTAQGTPGGMHTAAGNLNLFGKYVLLASRDYSNLLTGGLELTLPTGPKSFGGYSNIVGFRDTQIQPFLGFILTQGRAYLQGFTAVNVATDQHDVTFYFNDIAAGYYVYRNQDPRAMLSAIVPTFETHVNTPLNHRGFNSNDPASQPDVVNFTFGNTFILRQRSYLTFAYTTPVTGPHQFDYEIAVLFNYRFGGGLRSAVAPYTPPNASY